jgi:UDP-N-acetylglucosamine 1-carboxyvinyltransferase
MRNIGARIADLRESAGLTQAALAKKLLTTQSAVARIESGRQNVSTAMIRKLGRAFGRNLITFSPGTVSIAIEGGRKLKGIIETNTSKNGAVGLLCASLLNRGTTTLRLMPRIEEVYRLVEVLESIGVRAEWRGNDLTLTPPRVFKLGSINTAASRKTRSVVLLIGPLIHYLKRFTIPQSGGCKLGSRTVLPHFFALEHFGVTIETAETSFRISRAARAATNKGAENKREIALYESGDTVTENTLLAAALTPGETVIKYASANYMVQEVCHFLLACGVKIEGIGTTTLTVTGVREINAPVTYTLSEDPTDSMFFIAAAAVTRSAITITRCPIDFLELEILVLEKMGLRLKRSRPYLSHNGATRLIDLTLYPSALKAPPEKVHARPYPGLNADNLPFFAVIATQAKGQTLIHDWMYEKRALYFTELDRLGADTVLADPHRVYVTGATPLKAAELVCPPALRPATILLIAMLAASGRSVLRNIYSINRGYENLVARLASLGARISHLDEF